MTKKKPQSSGTSSPIVAQTAFWALEPKARSVAARAWFELLQDSADRAHLYVTQGIETSSEVLVWSTADAGDPAKPGVFFKQRAASENLYRAYFQPSDVLWGMTRPSQYSRAKSAQEIDPYDDDNERQPYLVMYPFTKTADWYLFGRETRQGMMNEHIRIRKAVPRNQAICFFTLSVFRIKSSSSHMRPTISKCSPSSCTISAILKHVAIPRRTHHCTRECSQT